MRPFLASAAAALLAVGVALPAQAGDYGYTPRSDVALSVRGGWWDADVQGYSGAAAYGVELSGNDTFLELPVGALRHMVSWNHADGDGLKLDSAEWNIHWTVQAGPELWIGAGPGLGYVWTDGRDSDDGGAAAQFGLSAYTIRGHMLLGVDSRYQWTEADSADNWLTMAKIGYVF